MNGPGEVGGAAGVGELRGAGAAGAAGGGWLPNGVGRAADRLLLDPDGVGSAGSVGMFSLVCDMGGT